MRLKKLAFMVMCGVVAALFFVLGQRVASGASGTINDIKFSQFRGHTRLSVNAPSQVDTDVAYDKVRNEVTIRLKAEGGDKFNYIKYTDENVESVAIGQDIKSGDTVINVKLSKPDVSFLRTPDVTSVGGIQFDFRPATKMVKLSGISPEQLVAKLTPKAKPAPVTPATTTAPTAPGTAVIPAAPVGKVKKPEDTTMESAAETASFKDLMDKKFVGLDKRYEKLDSESGRHMFIEMMELLQQQKFPEAVDVADKFIKTYPKSIYLDKVYYSKGDAMFNMAQKEPALSQKVVNAYKEAISMFPDSPMTQMAMLRKGNLMVAQQFYPESLAEYGLLLQKAPTGKFAPLAMIARASVYINQQKYEKAYNEIQKIIETYPSRPEVKEAKYILGTIYFDQNKFEDANKIFSESAKQWPTFVNENPEIYMKVAETKYKLGAMKDAIKDFVTISNIFTEHDTAGRAMVRLGDLLAENNDKKQAAAIFENVTRRFPDTSEAVLAQLRLASLGGDDPYLLKRSNVFNYASYELPFTTFDEIVQKYPDEHGQEALLRKGKALAARKRYVASIAAIREMLREYPESRMSDEAFNLIREDLLKLIETFYSQDGFFAVLLTYYENFDPFLKDIKDPKILFKLAESYGGMTLHERAIEYYKLADKYDTEGELKPLTSFRIAQSTLEKGEPKDAEFLLRNYLDTYPDRPEAVSARHLLGDSMWAQKKPAEAATEWRLAVEKSPSNPMVSLTMYKMGRVYKNQGQYPLAIDSFRRAIYNYKPVIKTGEEPTYIKDSFYRIADSYFMNDSYPEAIREANRFLKQYPGDQRKTWMDYIIASSLAKEDKDELALARLKEIADSDKSAIVGKVASARLETADWKRKNPDLFPD